MKKLFVLYALFFSFHTNAAWKSSPYVEIVQLYPADSGLIFFTTHADTTVSSCEGGKRFYLPKTGENYNIKASVLIAAYMSKKKIFMTYDSSQPKSCAAVINRFIVQK